jgi:rhodanese-related sulfurtransferase
MGTAGDDSIPAAIDRAQLQAKRAGRQPFKLVMAASDFGFRAKHIPGSLHVQAHGETFSSLAKDDDIVVYCSNLDCNASKAVIKQLHALGFTKVAHYAGGVIDWTAPRGRLGDPWLMRPHSVTLKCSLR